MPHEPSGGPSPRPRASALAGVAAGITLVFASFFVVVSFLAAESPAEAAARGHGLPAGWSAGVWNHGSYYRWWTVEERPWLLGLGILGLVAGFGIGTSAAAGLKEE